MRALQFMMFLAALGAAWPSLAETVIVSDRLPINVRGPGPQDRIIAAVKSGERLEVLDRQPGYIKIRSPEGEVGWVLQRFTQTEPVARERLAEAERVRDAAAARRDELEAELAELRAAHARLQDEHAALGERAQALEGELQRVKAAASGALEIQQANQELQEELATLRAQRQALENRLDAQDSRRSILVLGAGILLAGLLLGLIAPYLRPRRGAWSDI